MKAAENVEKAEKKEKIPYKSPVLECFGAVANLTQTGSRGGSDGPANAGMMS